MKRLARDQKVNRSIWCVRGNPSFCRDLKPRQSVIRPPARLALPDDASTQESDLGEGDYWKRRRIQSPTVTIGETIRKSSTVSWPVAFAERTRHFTTPGIWFIFDLHDC
ncbi:hypothetical protein GTR04_4067 [Trichophyton interdigitale]|uniref:Uncharacterized protein n=1 Tax=Trichophyton interdigitale TaxID=101480 RepID=A0A9P4YH52_9EURO|nr:hypothetical protein GY631_3811 [Trichophyton interdigitale]KAF3894880.1 hypothetical protein GY632_3532 [Trichophyton interdigitale]KAG8208556.1 hypothetical protein GTR04_4067 [Trichophyton interdigitale]